MENLLYQRKHAASEHERKELSVKIYSEMRRQRRRRSDDALDELICKGQAGKVHMEKQRPKIKKSAQFQDTNGENKSDQEEILDVFACFYEQLYVSSEIATSEPSNSECDFLM